MRILNYWYRIYVLASCPHCQYQDCKALLVLKKHVRSAIASTWTLPLPLPEDRRVIIYNLQV